MVAGPLCVLGALALLEPGWSSLPGRPDRAVFCFGLALLLLVGGLTAVLGTTRVTVDRSTGKVDRWWGLLGMGRGRSSDLGKIQRVHISRRSVCRRRRTFYLYEVAIDGPGRRRCPIQETGQLRQAQELAKVLSDFLGVRIADYSNGKLHTIPAPGE